ncbi:MAG: hypothetical protein ACK5P5_09305 [Pseudobdellovibrionaceae bacterium]
MELKLQTYAQYGTPRVRPLTGGAVVPEANGNPGQIRVELPTPGDFKCAPDLDSGWGIQMMGPHSATVKASVKPGAYDFVVDGRIVGRLAISENSVSLTPNNNYRSEIAALEEQEFIKVFGIGPQAPAAFEGRECSVTITDVQGTLEVAYAFAGSTSTLADGAVLTRPPVNGTAKLTSLKLRPTCVNESLSGWTAEISGQGDRLMLRASHSQRTYISFTTQSQKTCSK